MILYAVDKGKTFFSKDFKQISCSFSYIDDQDPDTENFGMFVVDVNWDEYFIDPILTRYQQVQLGSSWLESFDTEPVIVNDLFYNKLIEYFTLAHDKFGMALEIDDEDFDEIRVDGGIDDLYTEEQEVAIFNTMFDSIHFIEAFKNELDNPAKYNLLSAISYFQNPTVGMGEAVINTRIKFSKFLKEEVI